MALKILRHLLALINNNNQNKPLLDFPLILTVAKTVDSAHNLSESLIFESFVDSSFTKSMDYTFKKSAGNVI